MEKILWYVRTAEDEIGPVSIQELLRMVRHGTVRRETLVREEAAAEWTRASNVEGLFVETSLPVPVSKELPPESQIPSMPDRGWFRSKTAMFWIFASMASLLIVGIVVVGVLIVKEDFTTPKPDWGAGPSEYDKEPQQTAEEIARQPVRELLGHSDIINALAFSPDGRILLSGGGSISFSSGEETAADIERYLLEPESTESTESTEASEASEAPPVRLAGKNSLLVWDVSSGERVKELVRHSLRVESVAFSPDGRFALSADAGGNAILWNTTDWTEIHEYQGIHREANQLGETRMINAAAFSLDGRHVVLAGWGYPKEDISIAFDKKTPHLILWDVATGKEVLRPSKEGPDQRWFEQPDLINDLHAATYSPDGRFVIASASGNNAGVYYYSVEQGTPFWATGLKSFRTGILNRDFSNPKILRYQYEDTTFGSSGHNTPSASFVSVAISADGRRVVSVDATGRLCLWSFEPDADDPRKGVQRIGQMHLPSQLIRCAAFSMDGRYIATGGNDLFLWHATSEEFRVALELGPPPSGEFRTKSYYVFSLAFSPDGQFFVAGCDDHVIRWWKVP